MDFWKDTTTGKLYVHGRICDGLCPDGDPIQGALIHDAKDHKPIWMPWSMFKAGFEHVELRTSQEAWESGAHWYFMLTIIAGMIGTCMALMVANFAWSGIETRPGAPFMAAGFIIASALAYRRSHKLARNYQWDSWKRELKEGVDGD